VPTPTPSTVPDPSQAGTTLEFGQCLRRLREAAELTIRGLEAKVEPPGMPGLKRSKISEIERGVRSVSRESLVAYLTACGLPAAQQRPWKRAWTMLRANPPATGAEPRRLPRVTECDPQKLGVHSSIQLAYSGEAYREQPLPQLPQYVERDMDEELREAIVDAAGNGGLVVLVGTSSVGKTRTAYEAIRVELGDWRLWQPNNATELVTAVGHRQLPRGGVVVWLDELHHFLIGADGLTITTARALLNPDQPTVLIATMWPQWYERLLALPSAEPVSGDPHRHARQILEMARIVRLGDFSPSERARAEAMAVSDPRLAIALNDPDFGPTQVLAGAPQLVERWEYPTNPYARAIMTAAIDYRRLGCAAPLSSNLLEDATPGYLTRQEIAIAATDWFANAVNYATERLRGATSALILVPGSEMGSIIGYTVADYLLQHGQAVRKQVPPPGSMWEAAVSKITDPDARVQLAQAAHLRHLYRYAVLLATPAAEAGSNLAMQVLAWQLLRVGRDQDAEEWLRQAARGGNQHAMWDLVALLQQAGRDQELEGWLRGLAQADNMFAQWIYGTLLQRSGRVQEAQNWQSRAVDQLTHATRGDIPESALPSNSLEYSELSDDQHPLDDSENSLDDLSDDELLSMLADGRLDSELEWFAASLVLQIEAREEPGLPDLYRSSLQQREWLLDWAGRDPKMQGCLRRSLDEDFRSIMEDSADSTNRPGNTADLIRQLQWDGHDSDIEHWLRGLAEVGNVTAMEDLLRGMERAKRRQEADRLRRFGIKPGGRTDDPW
jgi:transcriptional regulator with XRE-family HTH domain